MLSTTRRRGLRASAFALAALALCSATAARAEDASGGKVVAIVNGDPITEADLAIVAQEYEQQLSQVPQEQRGAQLLNVYIDIKLLAKAAEAAGIDKSDGVVRNLAFQRARVLRNEYLKEKVIGAVTDEMVRTRFGEQLAKFEPADQVHVRHILVKTEDEAKAVIADLDKGGDFAEIAKAKSEDPGSAPNGGDLGFIGKGQTVPPFEAAVYALAVGTYSKAPVQTDYGWHVIKVEEKRKEQPPTFDTQKDQIRTDLLKGLFTKELDALHAAADVKLMDANGVPQPALPPGSAPAQGTAPAQ
jgi:peptidyl-prolyl cis-trans isomerase C